MRIINVEKKVGDFQLKIKDLNIEDGIIHGFIGANGCGKTTLAKVIMDILPKDSGEIELGRLTPKDMTMAAQRPYLMHTSVYENMVYPLKLRKMKPQTEEIKEYLDMCGLWEKRNNYARSLSSGEQQKLSLVRALIYKPKLTILDETLSNMDMESVELFERVIKHACEEEHSTFIIISHQMVHLKNMCRQLHFFDKGSFIESAKTVEQLYASKHPVIQKYMRSQLIEMR